MGEFLSFSSGLFLFVVALLVVKEYWPKRIWPISNMTPPTMLQVGIFFGFVLTAANTLWWQILNSLVTEFTYVTRPQFQEIGFYMDVLLKGGMAMVGLMHLWAKRKMERLQS